MTRCIWCNQSDPDRTVTLSAGRERRTVPVHAAHEASLVAWHARATREARRFVTTMVLAPLAVLAAVGLAALVSRAMAFAVIGLAIIALAAYAWTHPYATPQTVRLIGVRRSIALVRLVSVPLGLAGLVAMIAGLVSYA